MANVIPVSRREDVARLTYVAWAPEHVLGSCSFTGPESGGRCPNHAAWLRIARDGQVETLCWSHTTHRVGRTDRARAEAEGFRFDRP